jgi:uncharacterized protein YbjT (DUF2867 family)
MKKVLVIGGTGLLGEPVARRLHTDGVQVRVMSRSLEKARARFGDEFEVVAGDVQDQTSLEAGLEGCDGVHISVSVGLDHEQEPRGVRNVVEAAKKTGMQRLGYLSGTTVSKAHSWHPLAASKLEAETIIHESGLPYTIFKPTWFMEVLANLARGKQVLVMGKGDFVAHWVAVDDFARMAAKAYQLPEAANKTFFIHGPDAYSIKQAVEQYAAIAHPDKQVRAMPLWLLSLMSNFFDREQLKYAIALTRYFDKVTEGGDPTEANDLLGAPTITLEAWSKQNA